MSNVQIMTYYRGRKRVLWNRPHFVRFHCSLHPPKARKYYTGGRSLEFLHWCTIKDFWCACFFLFLFFSLISVTLHKRMQMFTFFSIMIHNTYLVQCTLCIMCNSIVRRVAVEVKHISYILRILYISYTTHVVTVTILQWTIRSTRLVTSQYILINWINQGSHMAYATAITVK